jgi:hypothetical protein
LLLVLSRPHAVASRGAALPDDFSAMSAIHPLVVIVMAGIGRP